MKTHQTFILVAICLNFAAVEVAAQKKSGEILHGVVESVDGHNITVNYRRKSRSFRLNDQATINYVGFLKAKKEINQVCHSCWVDSRALQPTLGYAADPF